VKRREFLGSVAALALAGGRAGARTTAGGTAFRRVRPGDPAWPSESQWQQLGQRVNGRLVRLHSPFDACREGASACDDVFARLANPYAIGDDPALTQTLGWANAWTTAASEWAVAAETPEDVAAAVDFARAHRLRLVVKGGGHSYQGTSCSKDSLLVWTRHMKAIRLHDAFVPDGAPGSTPPQPAVSVGAGAVWMHVYRAVTVEAGRYVQGGGCGTVGVAGLVQSGGFGSFSKGFGTSAAALLEAEVVTADGRIRVVNAFRDPELFWALKGGGGGSFGVVTRLTLRTSELPETVCAVFGKIRARSDGDYRALVARFMEHYRDRLFNPHWGEQAVFYDGSVMRLSMVSQGLTREAAEAAWQPFLDWLAARGDAYQWERAFSILEVPARRLWDVDFLKQNAPQVIATDGRPGAPPENFYWAGDGGQAGQFLLAYRSAWLPAALLADGARDALVDAIVAASRRWQSSLHFNKGLAGAGAEDIARSRDTATNPAVLDAFALAIVAADHDPALPGIPGHEPDLDDARREAGGVGRAMESLLAVAPGAGSYVSESDYFERDWERSFWGGNYERLRAAKRRYDPDGLFFVHHGVGSEDWSADGFTRVSST
jgi:FAD/FMN-containing dehydrogenase